MPFDINSTKGVQGLTVGVRNFTLPLPGLFGLSVGVRDVLDAPGIEGVSVGVGGNALLNLRPTNFGAITEPLTVTMSWAAHTAEIYPYSADFVTQRQFPLNTLITFQLRGAAYVSSTTTATLTTNAPTTVDIPVTLVANLNTYRRRRVG